MNAKQKEREEAIARLREWLKPGDTVYCILRHVSRSGMQREISLRLLNDGRSMPYDLDYNVSRALDHRIGKHDGGIVVGGCGMDMGFALVYELGFALWPDGFGCIGEGCRSEDHANGDRDYTPDQSGKRYVEWKLRGTGEIGSAFGEWRQREPYGGKRELYAGGETRLSYWLFDDEIESDEPAPQHWHKDGGYALQARWL